MFKSHRLKLIVLIFIATVIFYYSINQYSASTNVLWNNQPTTYLMRRSNQILVTTLTLVALATLLVYTLLVAGTGAFVNTEYFLITVITVMVLILAKTNNIFVLFLAYEGILVPATILVYNTSNTTRRNQVTLYFISWTQAGSFLFLLGIVIITQTTATYDLISISSCLAKQTDLSSLTKYLLFLGLGVKLPLWPFHNWLTKTHVEASTKFSIFLSGVLVKTALICLLKLNVFIVLNGNWFLTLLCIFGVLDSCLKLFTQTDLKKLIALTTILEMSLFSLLLLNFNITNIVFLKYFVIFHALVSAQFFFLTDCVQRRFHTRQLNILCGLTQNTPKLSYRIVLAVLVFSGFPLTVKFLLELGIITKLINFNSFCAGLTIISIAYITTVVFFIKVLTLCFGRKSDVKTHDLTIKETLILDTILILILILPFI